MGSIIGSVASIAGNLIGSHKAKKASKAAQASTVAAQNKVIDNSKANTSAITGLEAPYAAVGTAALPALTKDAATGATYAPFTLKNFQADPGYQFRLQQGEGAVNAAAAARGNFFSGGTVKSLSDFAGNQASSEYDNAYTRFKEQQQQQYNQMIGLANVGYSATGQDVNALNNETNSVNSALSNIGNAQSTGQEERGAISAKTATSVASDAGSIASSIFTAIPGTGGISSMFGG